MSILTAAAALDFAKRFWKPIVGGLVTIIAVIWFNVWKSNLEDAAYDRGFEAATAQMVEQVNDANERVANNQRFIDQLVGLVGMDVANELKDINIKISQPAQEARSEIKNNPDLYRNCATSDGVLNNINAARSAVDQSINSGNPKDD